MRRIGLILAMAKEWDALFKDTPFFGRSFVLSETKNGTALCGMVSGIGKVNAAIAAYKLIKEYKVTNILSFGCAGGASVTVHTGDVVVGNEYIYHDVNCGSPNAVGQVQGCPETFKSDCDGWQFLKGCRRGLIATGDTFVNSEVLATAITQMFYPEHCPLAFDMESAAIAQVCAERYVGFTSVRVISDNPFTREHTYDEFWERKDETLRGLFNKMLEME